jgi:CRISPR-associated protein Cas2
MRGQELLTFVVYDITSDRIRLKVAAVCKDYGLDHIQYSVFSGPLDATRRREMFARLGDTLGDNEGRILMLQLCEKDAAARAEIARGPLAALLREE